MSSSINSILMDTLSLIRDPGWGTRSGFTMNSRSSLCRYRIYLDVEFLLCNSGYRQAPKLLRQHQSSWSCSSAESPNCTFDLVFLKARRADNNQCWKHMCQNDKRVKLLHIFFKSALRFFQTRSFSLVDTFSTPVHFLFFPLKLVESLWIIIHFFVDSASFLCICVTLVFQRGIKPACFRRDFSFCSHSALSLPVSLNTESSVFPH